MFVVFPPKGSWGQILISPAPQQGEQGQGAVQYDLNTTSLACSMMCGGIQCVLALHN